MGYTNTSNTFLFHGTSSETLTKLADITSYPDIFTPPEKLQVTTLSDKNHKYIKGIADVPDLQFGLWYDPEIEDDIYDIQDDDDHVYELRFGEGGSIAKYRWTGTCFFTPTGGDVNGVRAGSLTCYATTGPDKVTTP